jgi:F-type H+-transporting ATPase subunit b
VKKSLRRYVLAGLALTIVFGVGVQARQMTARAQAEVARPETQAAGVATTPEAQSPEKNEQEKDENDAYLHSPMVVKLGAMLGMDAERSATVFQVANFALLALGIGWVAVKTLPKMLRDRSSAIQKHLVDARTATEEASTRLNSVEERLSKLDGQIAELRAQSEKDAVRDEARIKASVEEEKKNILAAAEQEISSATSSAQKQLQQYAAELAIEQAGRKLVVSAETDRLLVQSFAQRLAGDESKKGQN